MAQYPRIAQFMQRVRQANNHYERIKRSSLRPLIRILQDDNGTAQQVVQQINALTNAADATYRNKANKYKEALYYLQRTYPIAPGNRVSVNPVSSRAALLHRSDIPADFNTYGPGMYHNVQRLEPPTQLLNKTVEEYLYSTPGQKGIVMIHLSDYQRPAMDLQFDGWSVYRHMRSVLRVARDLNINVCALNVGANPNVCPELAEEVNAFPNPVIVHEQGHRHMGGAHQAFRDFVQNKQTVVVMGFDANICVHANIFGTTEHYATEADEHTVVPPIVSQANVITSRAILVTQGIIQGPEYGVLQGA